MKSSYVSIRKLWDRTNCTRFGAEASKEIPDAKHQREAMFGSVITASCVNLMTSEPSSFLCRVLGDAKWRLPAVSVNSIFSGPLSSGLMEERKLFPGASVDIPNV